jgi:hypothetical protein
MPSEKASATTATSPRRGRKYFSLEEANSALTYLERVVGDITDCYHEAVDVRQRLEAPQGNESTNELKNEYEGFMDRLNELIDELHHAGVELKDFEKGLVNFPAVHQGREIYLCWQRGDEGVRCWHEINAGFSGRQDVSLLARETSEQAA